MNPTLNGSSAIRHFKHSDAIEICNRIIFDFYTVTYTLLRISFLLVLSFQSVASRVQYRKWVLGTKKRPRIPSFLLISYFVAGGLPQLLGGFGGGVSTSSVNVPRTGMGGGAPPSSGNRLWGISVMLTVMGRTPVCEYNQMAQIRKMEESTYTTWCVWKYD